MGNPYINTWYFVLVRAVRAYTVRFLINEGWPIAIKFAHDIHVLNLVRKEISGPGFLDVSPIRHRLASSFYVLRKYFDTNFWWQLVIPGLVRWVLLAPFRGIGGVHRSIFQDFE